MNYPLILNLIGSILKYVGFLMVFPLTVNFIYNENQLLSFFIPLCILIPLGFLLASLKPKEDKFRSKEGFAAVALAWILVSVFGALPFYICGYFNSFIDCLFESVSGFTTTGSTILTQVENLPKSILFWRNFSHWIGGMGVLVLMLAIMPSLRASGVNLLKAEGAGPTPTKIVPKVRETAKIMYSIYFSMTAVQTILLIISGLPLFDSILLSFSSAGTGGFSSMNASVGAYNNVMAEVITTVFVFLFGVNFTLFFYLLRKNFKDFFLDEEFLFYTLIVTGSIAVITFNILNFYGSLPEAVRHASFQVVTIITSAGYSTTNYELWPTFSKLILVMLMFTGCCAGSTGGGLKIMRILILFKALKIEIHKIIHPRVVKIVKVNGKKVEDKTIMSVAILFFFYFLVLFLAVFLVSLDGKDLVSTVSSVITTISNVGPGFGIVGPTGNFSSFSDFSKIIFSFCMLAGRLEFFPVLILFVPSIWKRGVVN